MAAASAPITMKEVLTLPSLGINPQFITFTHVTMESDKYICVRETAPANSVVIIDMNMPMQPLRRPITADSALMNPNSRILALKAQIPGSTQDHLQIFNIEMKAKMKSYQMPEQVVFWKWITPKMLGLVTQTSVYHWTLEGDAEPARMFDRTANLTGNQIINYRCDPSEKWLVLIGIAPGAPERPQLVKGNMQLFSVDQQRSQALEAHAAAFASFKVPGNENPSILISFASKTMVGGQLTSKLHVIELGAQPGKPGFSKKQADLFFPPDFADDFPVAMQISNKYSLIYVITKLGLLFVYDLDTATAVYRNRISPDPIFLTTEASSIGGFYAINRRGQVLLATVNEATIVPFVSGQLNNLELAVNLAKRGNLPGAENLVVQRFQELFSQMKYKEAAELAAESPQGILRTPDTVAKFQSVPVQPGQTPPLLQYFGTLLTRGKLNAFESLELSRLVVNQNKKNLLENWLAEDKLECSEELQGCSSSPFPNTNTILFNSEFQTCRAMANPKTPPKNQSKFSVYVNPAISSALSARSLRPSMFAFAIIITVCLASAVAMLGLFVWEQTVVELIAAIGILQYIAYGVVKVLQIIVGLVFLAGILALLKALSLQRMADSNGLDVFQTPPRDSATRSTPNKPATRSTPNKPATRSTPNKPTPTSGFTEHQQELLGLRKRNVEQGNTDTPSNIGSRQQPQRSKKSSTPSPSSLLAPVHQLASKSSRGLGPGQSQWSGLERRDVGVSNISPFTIPVANRSPGSQGPPSLPGSQVPGQNTSPWDRQFSTPWSKPRPSLTKEEIPTEEKLEEFLADVEEKMSESASKAPTPSNQGLTTPSPSLHGIGGSTPSPVPNSGSFSGTPRNTSLRTVRMSPSSQKFSTPPKKGDGDLPPPMSLEQSMEAFQNLGVYPHIEQWSDRLRQWFSEVLLNPLAQKIETSHIQVMQAAAKLGISITITQVGSNVPDSGVPSAASSDNAANEWQTTFTLDEDGVLHQLRATLIQARDAPPTPQPSLLGLQPPKEKPFNPLIQECLDAVTEHQRLRALMKGEWVKGLLPQSSVRADYTVQRIKELAEGTCVKKYEFEGRGEFYDKVNKRWTLELPTDSHLLLYLFCALLEHPQWMLHVEPTSYPSTQSSNNPLFVGILPPRERFPEKYVAVLSSVPTVLHPGACVLVVGKQSPPVLALYWDKKLQFSLQGRTALWDAILLFCHRIKVAHGRMVRGINLGSSALNILSVFEPQSEGNVS